MSDYKGLEVWLECLGDWEFWLTLWFHGYLPVYFALNLIKWIEVEKFSFYAIMHNVFLLMSFPSSPRMEYGDGEGKGLGNDRGLTEYSFCPCITVSKHEGRRWETPPNYWLCKLQAPKMKAWFILIWFRYLSIFMSLAKYLWGSKLIGPRIKKKKLIGPTFSVLALFSMEYL